MLTAHQISHYLICISNHKVEDEISNLKLQKLLYYLQGFHLAIFNEPLFKEDIEAWGYGPVVSDVYHSYKTYGNNPIILPKEQFRFDFLLEEQKNFINKVYLYFRQFSAIKLMNLTHSEEPWNVAYKSNMSKVIRQEELKSFFSQHSLIQEFSQMSKEEERKKAALLLLPDYLFDKDLTEFSILDTEDFYES